MIRILPKRHLKAFRLGCRFDSVEHSLPSLVALVWVSKSEFSLMEGGVIALVLNFNKCAFFFFNLFTSENLQHAQK